MTTKLGFVRLGIAVGSDSMAGTTGAVIAVPGGGGSVLRYDMADQSLAGVTQATVQDLTATEVTQSGGNTVAKFTMPLPGVVNNGLQHVIFAYGTGNSLADGEGDNGATTIDFRAQPGCHAATSCHGHGYCNGTRCVCFTGYLGIDCGTCSPGFARRGSTVAAPCEADYSAASMRLDVPGTFFGDVGSATRDSFYAGFEDDVGTSIGVPPSSITVSRIRVAYREVFFRLNRVVGAVNVSVTNATAAFVSAFANPASALFSASRSVTQHIDRSYGVPVVRVSFAPPLAHWSCSRPHARAVHIRHLCAATSSGRVAHSRAHAGVADNVLGHE